MKPAPFALSRPESVEQALQLIQQSPDAKFIAGGQSLLAMMNFRLARPEILVDMSGLHELDRVFDEGDAILFGAMTLHRTIERSAVVRATIPMLADAATYIGHIAIRNQGTLGGTIAHSDPSAEIPATLLALNATVFVERNGSARREVCIGDLFAGLYSTTLEYDEMITWVRVPKQSARCLWGFAEIAPRHGDFAEAGCAVLFSVDADQRMTGLRVSFLGLDDRPVIADGADSLIGMELTYENCLAMGYTLTGPLNPPDRQEYRRHLGAVTFARACRQGLERDRNIKRE